MPSEDYRSALKLGQREYRRKSVRQYSVSPGNFAGGLSTVEEKNMGTLVKSGSRPIQGGGEGLRAAAPSGAVAAGLHPRSLPDAVRHGAALSP